MLIIIGRRWWDRRKGNTYHSTTIYRKLPAGPWTLVARRAFEYGHGDQYLTTACELLQEAGLWPNSGKKMPSGLSEDEYALLMTLRDDRSDLFTTVSDVARKGDL